MIARVTGVIAEVTEESAVVDLRGVAYEVLVPRFAIGEIAAAKGRSMTLHTMQYLEGSPAGGNLIPRLIGFTSPNDIHFFRKFTTVKNVGIRKALRALVEPVHRVAAAIETGDAKMLSKLPGIGARTADQIIAELRGKVTDFALGGAADTATPEWSEPQRDAIEILQSLGERRPDAEQWVAHIAEAQPELQSAEAIVKAAYRLRVGV